MGGGGEHSAATSEELADDGVRPPSVPCVARGAGAGCHAAIFLAAGPAVVGWGMDGLYWLVAGMVFSVLAAMFEAWVLLIEINR